MEVGISDNRTVVLAGGTVVEIKELNMGDMRAMLRARETMGDGELEPLEMLLIADGLLFSDLARLTNLTGEQIDQLTESEINQIVEAAKRLNPRFFDQILKALGRIAAASLSGDALSSNAMSLLSSGSDMPTPGTTQ